jgi:folate-dependent phosphoribosylglycinamide formyltransferase PurN
MRHIALFSQTGSEIANLIERGHVPDTVYYDQKDESIIDDRVDIDNYGFRILKKDVKNVKFLRELFGDPSECFITLHGWLNIIPKALCEEYKIFNGHPGFITKYPELKGKDPQKRAFEDREKYKFIGSVIHRVIPEVDEGEILYNKCLLNAYNSEEGVIAACKRISLSIWLDFFNDKAYN